MCEGWVKSYRSQVDWRWFKFPATAHLWHYLLLAAEYEEKEIGRNIIQRGQLLTTFSDISAVTGLTMQEIRTGLQRLEETGEITRKSTNKNTIVTLVKYEEYQAVPTNEQQTNNKRITNLPIKERNKEVKKGKIDYLSLVNQETPSAEVRQAAMDWIEMRLLINKPPTERAVKLAFTDIRKETSNADTAAAMFNQSTKRNWVGIFPLKD